MSILTSLRDWRKSEGLDQFDAGKRLKTSQANISRYERKTILIPPEKAIKIEKITGIPRSHLRPDLWGANA
jgi:transcriptional regulator with XRE-family HTH domain